MGRELVGYVLKRGTRYLGVGSDARFTIWTPFKSSARLFADREEARRARGPLQVIVARYRNAKEPGDG